MWEPDEGNNKKKEKRKIYLMTGSQGLKGKSLVRDDFKDAHNKNQILIKEEQ